MKANYILPLAALLASCTSDDLTAPVATESESATAFTATLASDIETLPAEDLDGATTRATLTQGTFTQWADADRMSITDGTLYFTYKPTQIDGATCTLAVQGTNDAFASCAGKTFSVFYPQAALQGWDGATAKGRIYAEQDYTENADNGLMGAYMATQATADADGRVHFAFQHTCSVIEVDVSQVQNVKSVSLLASGGSLAGRFTYNVSSKAYAIDNGDATPYSANTKSDVVTVSDVKGTTVRFYVLPQQQPHGLTITVETNDGHYYTKQSQTALGTTGQTDITLTGASTVCKPYYKKYNFGATTTARQNNWMATVPSNTYFAFLSTPGAHDAATSSVSSISTDASKAQSTDIADLLAQGVRALDLRPQYKSSGEGKLTYDNLTIYHGITSTDVLFKDAIQTISTFLTNNPTETVVINLNKENSGGTTDDSNAMWAALDQTFSNDHFGAQVHTGFAANLTLGSNLRGKMIILNRTGTTKSWSTQLRWDDKAHVADYTITFGSSQHACVEDNYEQYNHDDKNTACQAILALAAANTDANRHHITFANIAYKFAGKSILDNAKGMNPKITTDIQALNGPTGIVYADYLTNASASGPALLQAIIAQNKKVVYRGRSRHDQTAGTDTGAKQNSDEYADNSTVYVKQQR